MTLLEECTECWGGRDACGVCLGDGYLLTSHGRQVYEIARRAARDAVAGRDHPVHNVDHSALTHTCTRCRPPHRATA